LKSPPPSPSRRNRCQKAGNRIRCGRQRLDGIGYRR
jgi:hypothetical protein